MPKMRNEDNPCLYCDCYDPDMGCMMPSLDRSYACPLEDNKEALREEWGIDID